MIWDRIFEVRTNIIEAIQKGLEEGDDCLEHENNIHWEFHRNCFEVLVSNFNHTLHDLVKQVPCSFINSQISSTRFSTTLKGRVREREKIIVLKGKLEKVEGD